MKCRYCKHWLESKKRENGDPSKRLCEILGKKVNRDDSPCSYDYGKFDLVSAFWCEECGHWKSPLACIMNQRANKDECKYCSQGEEVQTAFDSWKTKLVRRKK